MPGAAHPKRPGKARMPWAGRAAAPPGNETGNAASIGPGRLPAAARTHGRRTEHVARKSRGQTSFFCFI